MGCSSSQTGKVITTETKENGINEQIEGGDRKYPPGEAFEVLLDDKSDSIIKKHPPKRLQRLVDAPTTQTTIEELEEKLANAEVRRNQFLTERVNTLKSSNDEGDGNENGNLVIEDQNNEIENNKIHDESPTVVTSETSLNISTTPSTIDDSNISNNVTQETN